MAEAVSDLADFVRCYEPIFLYLLVKNNTAARQAEVQRLKQTTTSEQRVQATDKAIEGLFEANISGKITDEWFTKMTANYETEQKELLDAEQTKVDLRLLMYSKDKGTKKVKVDIYFTAVGLFTIPTETELRAAMDGIRQSPRKFTTSA